MRGGALHNGYPRNHDSSSDHNWQRHGAVEEDGFNSADEGHV